VDTIGRVGDLNESRRTQKTMGDPEIPVAFATAVPMGELPTPIPIPSDYATPSAGGTTATTGTHPSLQSVQEELGRSSRIALPRGRSEHINENSIQQLQQQGYTRGLAESLIKTKRNFPLRFFLVDNSGSMQENDGHRFVETKKSSDVKLVSCTRWGEMQETVMYHCQLAGLIDAPTVFRLLNDPGAIHGPQQFTIAESSNSNFDHDLAVATSTIMNSSPGGVTPLVAHLREIRENVAAMESTLRQDGTRVAITIATYVLKISLSLASKIIANAILAIAHLKLFHYTLLHFFAVVTNFAIQLG
jgi:hypothetical protein